ncbi:unnamed protein product [Clonostachys rhizophaga]|uniref:Lytic polysaccharide monooxygenase n=1 Tax=Clonostachys rhizophaga TaxID=160324 RepID=A0A9N9VS94_9HYPO|nr:unnamed protein product [Clonostachys rhizophaga]
MFPKTFAIFGLAAVASAHMFMENPVAFTNPSNSPLEADGSDFPCRGVTSGDGSESNVYEQGSTHKLKLQGTAVHGGGSCQISITTDIHPTRESRWKTIKSIEGGCPARGQKGNMGNDPFAEDPYTYNFTIPKELATGDYIIAWTWFNKIGNREMYMDCGPLTVMGSGGDEDFFDTLPDMFIANIDNGCSTPQYYDIQFPNPGNDLEQLNGKTTAWAQPTGTACFSAGIPSSAKATPTPAPTPIVKQSNSVEVDDDDSFESDHSTNSTFSDDSESDDEEHVAAREISLLMDEETEFL